MISVSNITIAFGGESLFQRISFIINDRDRIGLVGKNGTGKSTILKIMKGTVRPDEGEIITPDGATIGYLPQELLQVSSRTVKEEALTAFEMIQTLQKEIDEAERELQHRTDYTSAAYRKLLKKHADDVDRFHLFGGLSIEEDVAKVLSGLGFEKDELDRPMRTFSSGWQMRVALARILLAKPDLILLDEPTNHLDIESIQWLEGFLVSYPGAVILVSHDRAFLDNVTNRTLEISLGKLYDYRSNYSGYVEMREERMESQLATFNNQQRQIRQIERFIERFRYKSTKARQVQSRLKMLEKIDLVEVDETDETSIHFRFPPAPHSGKIVAEAVALTKDYPGKRVLDQISFSVIRHDRIAFVGRNGEGKTTLSKILAGTTDHHGTLKFGHHIVTGYYAQDQSDYLDPEKTVFQTIDEIATGDIRTRIKTILGGFLFSGDDIEKKVKVLSGGEKSRLSLARLLLIPNNLLILDEPTNHLDMRSKDVLKNALIRYDGTLVIVSHDRDFLQGLTNRVFEFRRGKIREYLGDIYDFLETRKMQHLRELEQSGRIQERISEPVSARKVEWEQKKQQEKEARKLSGRISRCEQNIHTLEEEIKILESKLGDPENNQQQIADGSLYRDYQGKKAALNGQMEIWESLHLELEKIKEAG